MKRILVNIAILIPCIILAAEQQESFTQTISSDNEKQYYKVERFALSTAEKLTVASTIIYGESTLELGIPDEILQPYGMIRFNGSMPLNTNRSRVLADNIYHLCKNSDNLPQAVCLLKCMPENTEEERLHRLVAVMRIGETCMADSANHNKAHMYFLIAMNTHQFTGAMINLSTLYALKNEPMHVESLVKSAVSLGYKNADYADYLIKLVADARKDTGKNKDINDID